MQHKRNKEDFMGLPRLTSAIFIAVLLQSAAVLAATNASCTFDTFSAPSGYTFSQVEGVSDDGSVVGQLVDNKTQKLVAFTRSPNGVFTEYAAPAAAVTWMYGRNRSGASAGYYQDAKNPGHLHGFMLKGSKLSIVNYPKAANTFLFDVNQPGTAVGSFSAGVATKGFLLANGIYNTISYPNAQATYPMAISDNGAVVGSYSTTIYNGFLWQNGTFTTINYRGAKYGTALTGVNNSGVIVGNQLHGDRDFGFIYKNGVFKSIVYPGASFTLAGGINNNGLISGQIYVNVSGTDTLGYTAVCK
jgi:uncharacterized membrane protein